MVSHGGAREVPSRPRWVRPTQAVLFALGLVILSWTGFVIAYGYLYQIYEGERFDRLVQLDTLAPARPQLPAAPTMAAPAKMATHSVRRETGNAWADKPIARLQIPSVGISDLVLEGDDEHALMLGAGHIPGTALPGSFGNVVIAGHRDTFFRPLREIEVNDPVILKTTEGAYTYRVSEVEVVDADTVAPLEPTPNNTLTLVTCYPFNYIGHAPKRFIVRAYRTTFRLAQRPVTLREASLAAG